MLLGEEKKDSGGYGFSPLETTTGMMTPNPLVAPSAAAVAVSMPVKMEISGASSEPQPQDQQPPAAAASSLGKTPAGVPNPIMMASNLPFYHPPLQATQQMADDGASNTTAMDLGGTYTSSSVLPSPLASPIFTTPTYYDPPSRPASTLSVGTSASTMDAMASVLNAPHNNLDAPILGENCEPPTARRRRANTIHWATSQTMATATHTSRTNSPTTTTSLQNNETLQPVNFGDHYPPPTAVNFSTGSGWGAGQRKLSNASSKTGSSSSASSLGMRTASSNSLYSEYSCDSGSAAIGSPGPAVTVAMGSGGPTTAYSATATAPTMGTTTATARTGTSAFNPMKPSAPIRRTSDKRQKRLERNRESARASRRRRKHYLEELELKVSSLSLEMDRGRLNHACMAVRTVRGMRLGKLREAERSLLIRDANAAAAAGFAATAVANRGIKPPVRSGIQHNVTAVPTPLPKYPTAHNSGLSLEQQTALLTSGGTLSRTSDELQIVQTFMKQQLLSLVQPTANKFVLWLSLQKDGFYRGGRSASERLSAARIGERLLHSGTLRAAPCDGMWPLVCHEIGLSYDQEERIRQTQRSVLGNSESWINRHTAVATKNVMESVHTAIGGAQDAAKRREKKLMSILTPEQRVKFLAWSSRRSDVIRRVAESKFRTSGGGGGEGGPFGEEEYKTSPDRHVAANMYITDHQLSNVKQRIPPNTPNFVHPSKLKKLSRRPSFESLAGQSEADDNNSKQLNRGTSFPSTGSFKRSLNDVLGNSDNSIIDPNNSSAMMMHSSSQNGVSPESAHAAGQAAVMVTLNDILPIIPKSALHYSPNPNPHYTTAAYPPQAVPSSSTVVVSQPQAFQPAPAPKYQQPSGNNIMPQHYSLQLQSSTSSATTPSPTYDLNEVVDDIPMPTPVSVLLRTSDDFISELPYEESLEVAMMAPSPSAIAAANSDYAIPEQVASFSYEAATGTSTTATAGLFLGNRHQSAPQLHHSLGSPPQDFGYSSLSLAAPMAMIPESSLVNNPIVGQVGRDGDIGDFALEDLPELGADEWAIGEGFDMDVEQEGAA